MSCLRATSTTLASLVKLSSTIRPFSADVERRRRSGPDKTATVVMWPINLQINGQAISCEDQKRKAVPIGCIRKYERFALLSENALEWLIDYRQRIGGLHGV